MPLPDRIKKARADRRMTQSALARAVGVTRNAVTAWEQGHSEPTPERLRNLAVFLGVGYEWLATGRKPRGESVPGLPLWGEIAAGVWSEVAESQDNDVERVPVAPDARYPADAQFALRVRGNSIDKIAPDGSILTCVDIHEAGLEVRIGDLVCVERTRNGLVETTIKTVRRGKKSLELWPESTDPAHQAKIPWGRNTDEVRVKALVIGVYRSIARGA